MTLAAKLDQAIKAVCPITGVSIGNEKDRSTWRIQFDQSATDIQRVQAQSVLNGFVYTPDDPADMNREGKMFKAACIYFGGLLGKTPAEVRTGIKAVYDKLP